MKFKLALKDFTNYKAKGNVALETRFKASSHSLRYICLILLVILFYRQYRKRDMSINVYLFYIANIEATNLDKQN